MVDSLEFIVYIALLKVLLQLNKEPLIHLEPQKNL